MIGIAGVARSGKDTLAKYFSEIIEKDLSVDVEVISFADLIKHQLKDFLFENYKISSFTEETEEKEIIRPLLVAHGEQMKAKFGEDVWVKSTLDKIKESNKFTIISDVRFPCEVDMLKEQGGIIVHISKIGNQPNNELERKNDPLVAKASDLQHFWPPYDDGEIGECLYHAQILWQMIIESKQEEWTKTYH